MPALKIGVQLRPLGLPLREALVAAKRLGAQGVEIDARTELRPAEVTQTARRQLRKLLDDQGLVVSAISFPTRRGYQDPSDLDRRVDATKRALELAQTLGAPVVVNQLGLVPTDQTSREWTLLVEVLTDLAHFGNRVGASLAADTGTEPGPTLKTLLDALPPGGIAVNLDPGNLVAGGFALDEAVTELGPWIRHVHARDGVHDRARGRGTEVTLGRGSVDFAALLGQLEEQGYRGFFTVARDRVSDPETELSQAIQYLRNL